MPHVRSTLVGGRAVLTLLALTTIGMLLAACSHEIKSALSEGCDGLPSMANAYAAGDRAALDAASDRAERLAFADFRGPDLTDDEALIADATVASRAYSTLYAAAYEPVEANNGAQVWRGKQLTTSQQREIDEGLEVCRSY